MSYYRSRYKPLDQLVDLTDYQKELESLNESLQDTLPVSEHPSAQLLSSSAYDDHALGVELSSRSPDAWVAGRRSTGLQGDGKGENAGDSRSGGSRGNGESAVRYDAFGMRSDSGASYEEDGVKADVSLADSLKGYYYSPPQEPPPRQNSGHEQPAPGKEPRTQHPRGQERDHGGYPATEGFSAPSDAGPVETLRERAFPISIPAFSVPQASTPAVPRPHESSAGAAQASIPVPSLRSSRDSGNSGTVAATLSANQAPPVVGEPAASRVSASKATSIQNAREGQAREAAAAGPVSVSISPSKSGEAPVSVEFAMRLDTRESSQNNSHSVTVGSRAGMPVGSSGAVQSRGDNPGNATSSSTDGRSSTAQTNTNRAPDGTPRSGATERQQAASPSPLKVDDRVSGGLPAPGSPEPMRPSPSRARREAATTAARAAAAAAASNPLLRSRGWGRGEGAAMGQDSERLIVDEEDDKKFKNQPLPLLLARVVRLWLEEQEWPRDVRSVSRAQVTTLITLAMTFLLVFITATLLSASAPRHAPAHQDWGSSRQFYSHTRQQQQEFRGALHPSADWLLHAPEDLELLANGSIAGASSFAAPSTAADLPVAPHTCWSMQERHFLYPTAATVAASDANPSSTYSASAMHKDTAPADVPSPALLDALRAYERMHKRCVAEVQDWSKHTESLEHQRQDCRYVVWLEPKANSTVAARFLSLLSAFLYGLLTNRALLVRTDLQINSLLCQPFPGSSWWAPRGMLPQHFMSAPHQGEWVNGSTANQRQHDTKRTDVVMVQLKNTKFVWDMQFFCDSMQNQIAEKAVWVLFNTNQYLGPGFFLIDSFRSRLLALFPSRIVLQHLARYLLHPTNAIWDRISRIYEGYLYPADFRIGVEIAVLGSGIVNQTVNERVLQCGTRQGLFPHPIASDQFHAFLNTTAATMRKEAAAAAAALGEVDAAESSLEDESEQEMRVRRGRKRQQAQAGARWGRGLKASDARPSRKGWHLRAAHQNGQRPFKMRQLLGRASRHRRAASASGASALAPHLDGPRALLEARRKVLSVFVSSSSLSSFVHLKRAFSERPMEDHSIVTVHSESVEELEESRVLTPDQKAVAELWILSMSDGLLVSFMSAAGYLASGLAGKAPLSMNIVDWDEEGQEGTGGTLSIHNKWRTNNKPVCERSQAAEGCFLAPPDTLTCTSDPRGDGSNGTAWFRRSPDPLTWLPYVRGCQDYEKGLSIVPKFRFPT